MAGYFLLVYDSAPQAPTDIAASDGVGLLEAFTASAALAPLDTSAVTEAVGMAVEAARLDAYALDEAASVDGALHAIDDVLSADSAETQSELALLELASVDDFSVSAQELESILGWIGAVVAAE